MRKLVSTLLSELIWRILFLADLEPGYLIVALYLLDVLPLASINVVWMGLAVGFSSLFCHDIRVLFLHQEVDGRGNIVLIVGSPRRLGRPLLCDWFEPVLFIYDPNFGTFVIR